jgi:hypothetical protein
MMTKIKMTYLDWNKALYNYFFPSDYTKDDTSVVLGCTDRIIEEIATNYVVNNERESIKLESDKDLEELIDTPIVQFIRSVLKISSSHISLQGLSNQLGAADSLLGKAKIMMEAWNNQDSFKQPYGKPKVFIDYHEPPYIGIICALTYAAYDIKGTDEKENDYWEYVKKLLGRIEGKERSIINDLFKDLESKEDRFHHYLAIKAHVNVGPIYSQTPLTKEDEMQLKAHLFKDPSALAALKDNSSEYLLEEIESLIDSLVDQLKARTQRYWYHSDVEREITTRYVVRNVPAYLKEIEQEESELRKLIAQNKKGSDVEVKYAKFIEWKNENFDVRHGILISENALNLPEEGEILFSNAKHEFTAPLGYLQVRVEEKNYRCLLLDEKPKTGKYTSELKKLDVRITNTEVDFPLFYSSLPAKDSSSRHLFHILDSKVVPSSVRIIHDTKTNNEFLSELRTLKIESFPNNQLSAFSIIQENIDRSIKLFDRTVKRISQDIEVHFNGLKNGHGINSFVFGFPVYVSVRGDNLSCVKVFKEGRPEPVFSKRVELLAGSAEVLKELSIGIYELRLYDETQREIIPQRNLYSSFSITESSNDVRVRLEELQAFDVSNLSLRSFNTLIDEASSKENDGICFSREEITSVVDAALSIRGVINPYSEKLREHLIPQLLSSKLSTIADAVNYQDDIILKLAKELFQLFDDLGYVHRLSSGSYRWLKPYWTKGASTGVFVLRGALMSSERKLLEGMDGIKSFCQSRDITLSLSKNVPLSVRFELPKVFYRNSGSANSLPKLDGVIVEEPILLPVEFEFASIFETKISVQSLPISTIQINENHDFVNASIAGAMSVARFDWKSFSFSVFQTAEEFESHMSFAGIRLIRIQERVASLKHKSHYFIFERAANESFWKVDYCGPNVYAEVKYAFIKRLKYFDLSTASNKYTPVELRTYLLSKTTIQKVRHAIIEVESPYDLTELINYRVQIGLVAREFKKSLFVYDERNRLFGYSIYLQLPGNIVKALIQLSGLLPFEIELETLDLEQSLVNLIKNNKSLNIKSKKFVFHREVPEELARKISINLSGVVEAKNITAESLPYTPVYIEL